MSGWRLVALVGVLWVVVSVVVGLVLGPVLRYGRRGRGVERPGRAPGGPR